MEWDVSRGGSDLPNQASQVIGLGNGQVNEKGTRCG